MKQPGFDQTMYCNLCGKTGYYVYRCGFMLGIKYPVIRRRAQGIRRKVMAKALINHLGNDGTNLALYFTYIGP